VVCILNHASKDKILVLLSNNRDALTNMIGTLDDNLLSPEQFAENMAFMHRDGSTFAKFVQLPPI